MHEVKYLHSAPASSAPFGLREDFKFQYHQQSPHSSSDGIETWSLLTEGAPAQLSRWVCHTEWPKRVSCTWRCALCLMARRKV